MSELLLHMMAEFESWEAAAEFNIPQQSWADYTVNDRVDDLYIATFSHIFSTLREDSEDKKSNILSCAKTLLVFSKSAASKYISGVEKNRNLLYSAALYYLADQPPTAFLIAKDIDPDIFEIEQEKFLYSFLSRISDEGTELSVEIFDAVCRGEYQRFDHILDILSEQVAIGLQHDPLLFVSSKFAYECIDRFKSVNVWSLLERYSDCEDMSVWNDLLSSNGGHPIWELLPSQVKAVESGILTGEKPAYSMQMPTSAGKTSLCEIIIFNEVKVRGNKVLFLVPFRALAAEVKAGMYSRLSNVGVEISASYGGNIPTRSESTTVENSDVVISTPEKFEALCQVIPDFINRFDVLICDEGHLIDDGNRGLQYELLLTKFKRRENPVDKIVFISAILPNVSDINDWLGGDEGSLINSNYKPVVTDYSFVRSVNDKWFLDFNPHLDQPYSYFLSDFIQKDELKFTNQGTGNSNLLPGWSSLLTLACASAFKASISGSVILFTTEKGGSGVRGLANKCLDMLGKNAFITQQYQVENHPVDLVSYISMLLGEEHLLTRLVQKKIGYHHGDLPQELRREMEQAINDQKLNILICTSTLAEGVNLPIRTIVLHTVKRFNGRIKGFIEKRNIKNIIGRAGRAGKETRGRVIFANESERDYALEVINDVQLESAHGFLFSLIKALKNYLEAMNLTLNQEFFDSDVAKDISYIFESIDMSLLQSLPEDIPEEDIDTFLDQMLSETLASKFCDEEGLTDLLKMVFSLRTERIFNETDPAMRAIMRNTGSSLNFLNYVEASQILEQDIWRSLTAPQEPLWFNSIIKPVLNHIGYEDSADLIIDVLNGWVSGSFYIEIAEDLEQDVDDIVSYVCTAIGFELQQTLSQLTRFAIELYEDEVPDHVVNWPQYMQYGVNRQIHLRLINSGVTDRLAVFGVARFLDSLGVPEDIRNLRRLLRVNREALNNALEQDPRVPALSISRFFDDYNI